MAMVLCAIDGPGSLYAGAEGQIEQVHCDGSAIGCEIPRYRSTSKFNSCTKPFRIQSKFLKHGKEPSTKVG